VSFASGRARNGVLLPEWNTDLLSRVLDAFHDEEKATFPPSVPCVKRVNEIGLILLLDVYTVTEYFIFS
jgi:hypothetical protein